MGTERGAWGSRSAGDALGLDLGGVPWLCTHQGVPSDMCVLSHLTLTFLDSLAVLFLNAEFCAIPFTHIILSDFFF